MRPAWQDATDGWVTSVIDNIKQGGCSPLPSKIQGGTLQIRYLQSSIIFCRCAAWVQNSRLTSLEGQTPEYLHKNRGFCADHFEECIFMNTANKNKLVVNAVPTLFDVPNPPPQVATKRPFPRRTTVPEPQRKQRKTGT
jgi:hypothetical protein